jgi:hypothetical protein
MWSDQSWIGLVAATMVGSVNERSILVPVTETGNLEKTAAVVVLVDTEADLASG